MFYTSKPQITLIKQEGPSLNVCFGLATNSEIYGVQAKDVIVTKCVCLAGVEVTVEMLSSENT